jgi:hypothetical protein
VFTHCDDPALLGRHAAHAYKLGLTEGDRGLVKLACERGGAQLRADDALPLLHDALEQDDGSWLDFAAAHLDTLPTTDPDRVQLFLARQAKHQPERVADDAALLRAAPDAELGRWLADLAEGRVEDALHAAPDVATHPIAAAIAAETGPAASTAQTATQRP